MFVTESQLRSTSNQFKHYLLCPECEDLFSRNGETWVMRNCYRGKAGFFIFDQLMAASPVFDGGSNDRIYASTQIPEIQADKLIYFAISVFWRAGVTSWKIRDCAERIRTQLGPYEYPMRMFLLGQTLFPDSMELIVRVTHLEGIRGAAMMPHSFADDGFHVHGFGVPGIDFLLFVGSNIPGVARRTSFSGSKERFIICSEQLDHRGLDGLFKKWRKHHPNFAEGTVKP